MNLNFFKFHYYFKLTSSNDENKFQTDRLKIDRVIDILILPIMRTLIYVLLKAIISRSNPKKIKTKTFLNTEFNSQQNETKLIQLHRGIKFY